MLQRKQAFPSLVYLLRRSLQPPAGLALAPRRAISPAFLGKLLYTGHPSVNGHVRKAQGPQLNAAGDNISDVDSWAGSAGSRRQRTYGSKPYALSLGGPRTEASCSLSSGCWPKARRCLARRQL